MQTLSDVELPTLPQIAHRLVELCGCPNADIDAVVEAVSLDAALSAAFIRTANSAYYGQQYTVNTLRRAAIVLGSKYVKTAALGFHLAEASSQWKDVPVDLPALWHGNLLRGCLARSIAFYSTCPNLGDPGEAFLVGLLQDLAVPVVGRCIGPAYADCLGAGGLYTTEELAAVERSEAVEDHASLAGWLCEQWQFPPAISCAIGHHHLRPHDVAPSDASHALWQIAYWVGAIPFHEDHRTAPVRPSLQSLAIAAFDLDTAKLSEAFASAIDDYERLRPVFGRVLPPDADGTSLLRRAERLVSELLEGGPATETNGSDQKDENTAASAADGDVEANRPRVLLADDDSSLREALTVRLTHSGFDVVDVPDGDAAIAALDSGSFDVALLDIRMPGTDGLGVCEHIRNCASGASMPVFIMTGADDGIVRRHLGTLTECVAGNRYLLKPFDTEALIELLRTTLSEERRPAPTCQ